MEGDNNDEGTAHSTHGSFTASLLDQFSWFRPTSTTASVGTNQEEEEEWMQDKEQEISSCLNGTTTATRRRRKRKNLSSSSSKTQGGGGEGLLALSEEDDTVVDLWKLRQLAITKGGYLSNALRRQAWPKLVCAYQDVVLSRPKSVTPESVATRDYQRLRRDVPRTQWQIEAHVVRARHRQQQLDTTRRRRKVNFLPGLVERPTTDHDSQSTASTPLDTTVLVVVDSQDHDDDDDSAVPSPLSGGGACTPTSHSSFPFTATTAATALSEHEQAILTNIVVGFLRTPVGENPHFEDDRFRYFAGLVDLTALILVTLESPSLTKLVLQKLGQWHLRDASRPSSRGLVETTLRLCFKPLLLSTMTQGNPSVLVETLLTMDYPNAAVDWILCWFARQFNNLDVMNRVLDFFMASHAMMPLYFCISFLTHPKSQQFLLVDDSVKDVKILQLKVAALPSVLLQQQQHEATMELVENLVQKSLELMQAMPPSALYQQLLSDGHVLVLPTIAMLQPASAIPSWAVAPSAPTDWALIQRAKIQRLTYSSSSPHTPPPPPPTKSVERQRAIVEPVCVPSSRDYPLALAASGMQGTSRETRSPGKRAFSWTRVATCLAVMTAVLGGVAVWQGLLVTPQGTAPASEIKRRTGAMANPTTGNAKVPATETTRRTGMMMRMMTTTTTNPATNADVPATETTRRTAEMNPTTNAKLPVVEKKPPQTRDSSTPTNAALDSSTPKVRLDSTLTDAVPSRKKPPLESNKKPPKTLPVKQATKVEAKNVTGASRVALQESTEKDDDRKRRRLPKPLRHVGKAAKGLGSKLQRVFGRRRKKEQL